MIFGGGGGCPFCFVFCNGKEESRKETPRRIPLNRFICRRETSDHQAQAGPPQYTPATVLTHSAGPGGSEKPLTPSQRHSTIRAQHQVPERERQLRPAHCLYSMKKYFYESFISRYVGWEELCTLQEKEALGICRSHLPLPRARTLGAPAGWAPPPNLTAGKERRRYSSAMRRLTPGKCSPAEPCPGGCARLGRKCRALQTETRSLDSAHGAPRRVEVARCGLLVVVHDIRLHHPL